jgi:hypothetical protein
VFCDAGQQDPERSSLSADMVNNRLIFYSIIRYLQRGAPVAVILRREDAAKQTGGNKPVYRNKFVSRSRVQPATDGWAPLSAAIDTSSNLILNKKASFFVLFQKLIIVFNISGRCQVISVWASDSA